MKLKHMVVGLLCIVFLPLYMSHARANDLDVSDAIMNDAKQWLAHHQFSEIEKAANTFRETQARTPSDAMYARVYWYASQAVFGDRLFLDSSISWPRMKKSMDSVLVKYPDQWNVNNFTRFSCLAKDKVNAKALFGKMKETIPDAWPNLKVYDWCKAWAFDVRPNDAVVRVR